MTTDTNLQTYQSAEVAAHYALASGLDEPERALFERWLKSGMAILDIGVGGGRTTPYLKKIASRYVGIDYAPAMIDIAKGRFPDTDFRVCDATDMAEFADGDFDSVVFSFNGIDNIPNDAGRARCFMEINRVLRPGGIFLFSSHNARMLGVPVNLQNARGIQVLKRCFRALYASMCRIFRALFNNAFWRGQGYVAEKTHGGLILYVSTPAHVRSQLAASGFSLRETLHAPSLDSPAILTPWFYYAAVKSDS